MGGGPPEPPESVVEAEPQRLRPFAPRARRAVVPLLAPLLNVALESFRQYVPGRAGSVPGAPFTAENYLEFLHPAYLLYFYDTFRISLIATVLGIAVGLPVAHLVARRGSGVVRRLWVGFLVAMMFLSVLVRVYSIQLTLGPVGLLRIVGSSPASTPTVPSSPRR